LGFTSQGFVIVKWWLAYRYLISYKIAKKTNPMKWICLYQKRYHKF